MLGASKEEKATATEGGSMMTHLFVDDPWLIYFLLGLAEVITLLVWWRRRTRRTAWLLAVWPAMAVAVGVLAWAVDTPTKNVTRTWAGIVAGIKQDDARKALAGIAEDFSSVRLTKSDLAKMAPHVLPLYKGESLKFESFEIKEIRGRTATAETAVTAQALPVRMVWQLKFGPQADGVWRLTEATCLQPEGITLRDATR
jgi:hypothetical protein